MLQALAFSSPDDPDNYRFTFNVATTFCEAEGREIERIMESGAPEWVLAIRERLGQEVQGPSARSDIASADGG
jgi:hypothetical protein